MEKIRKFHFEADKIKLNQVYVLFMHLINLTENTLYRKYWAPLHNLFENWTRGTSYLKTRGTSHIKSDLINNMNHMRISGTEPSSGIRILSQTK